MIDFEKLQLRHFEDFDTLYALEKIFIQKRGWVSKMPRKNSSVVLILSGGIDSVCLWNLLLVKYHLNVYPIYFIDQKVKGENQELKSIRHFSKIFKEKYPSLWHDIFIKDYSFSFSFSSLKRSENVHVDLASIYSNLLYLSDQNASIPSLIDTPSRLGIYSFGAFEYAHLLRAQKNVFINTLLLGIVPEDGLSVRESTLSVLRSINLSLCLLLGDFNWQILAPIDKEAKFYLGKKDLVNIALQTNLRIDKTWSCRKYNVLHCGICQNCTSRKAVFKLLNFKDSTVYAHSQSSKKTVFMKGLNYVKKSFNKRLVKETVNKRQSPSDILSSSIINPSQDASWHKLKKGFFIMNQNTSNVERLNPVGAFIWEEIVSERPTFSSLVTKITSNYEVTRSIAIRDLTLLLKNMEKKGYITIT